MRKKQLLVRLLRRFPIMTKFLNFLFVTMFGLGKIKFMPGTFGSLATVIILYIFFSYFRN